MPCTTTASGNVVNRAQEEPDRCSACRDREWFERRNLRDTGA